MINPSDFGPKLQTVQGEYFDTLECNLLGKHHITRRIPKNRVLAGGELLLSPLIISATAIVRIFYSLANIFSGGKLAVYVGNTTKDERGWSVLRSTASLLLTPASIAVEAVSALTHVFDPEVKKIDYLAVRIWSGGLVSGSEKEDIGKGHILCSQGVQAMTQNKFETAKDLFQKAADHGNIAAMRFLGDLSLKANNIEEAKNYSKKAIEAPSQPGIPCSIPRALAYLILAMISRDNSHFTEAKKYLEQAFAIDVYQDAMPFKDSEGHFILPGLCRLALFKGMRELYNKDPSLNKQDLLEIFHTEVWIGASAETYEFPIMKEEISTVIDLLKNADSWASKEIAEITKTAFREGATDREKIDTSGYILGRIYESRTPPDVEKARIKYAFAACHPGLTEQAGLDAAFRAGKLAESMAKDPHLQPTQFLTLKEHILSLNKKAMDGYLKAATRGHKEAVQAAVQLHKEMIEKYGHNPLCTLFEHSVLNFFLFEALLSKQPGT